jgi:hypothetical protein
MALAAATAGTTEPIAAPSNEPAEEPTSTPEPVAATNGSAEPVAAEPEPVAAEPEPEPEGVLAFEPEPEVPAIPVPPPAPKARKGGASKKFSTTLGAGAADGMGAAASSAAGAPAAGAGPAATPVEGPPTPATPSTPTAQPPATQPTAPGAIPGWGQPTTPSATPPAAAAASAPIATPAPTPAAPPPPPPAAPTQVTPLAAAPAAQQPGPVRPTAAAPAVAAAATAAAVSQPAARAPEAADDGIQSRRPQDVATPKPKPVASVPERVAQPGDRICAACSEPNDPTRKFCRRCGASLVEARVVAAPKVPWYRRLFGGGGQKQPKQYAAGERISSMEKGSAKAPRKGIGDVMRTFAKGRGLVVGLLGILVFVGFLGYFGLPSFRGQVDGALSGGPQHIIDNIRKAIAPTPEIVTPTAVTSGNPSADVKGHPPQLVWDKATNTDWQTTDKTPTLNVTFKDKIDLMFVLVYPGNSANFVAFRRPSKIEIDFPDGTSQTIDLQDTKDKQSFSVSKDGISSLTIKVIDTNGPDAAPLSISEIEFNKKT